MVKTRIQTGVELVQQGGHALWGPSDRVHSMGWSIALLHQKLVITIDDVKVYEHKGDGYVRNTDEPLGTVHYQGNLLEVSPSHPGSYNHDMQSLRLLVDGKDVDQPPERDTAEVLAELNITHLNWFVAEGVETEADLRLLKEPQSRDELGVTKLGDRNRLLSWIRDQQQKVCSSTSSSQGDGNGNGLVDAIAVAVVGNTVGAVGKMVVEAVVER